MRWEQKDLAAASGISLPSIKRIETKPGTISAFESTLTALRAALEAAGIEFLEDGATAGAGARACALRQLQGEGAAKAD